MTTKHQALRVCQTLADYVANGDLSDRFYFVWTAAVPIAPIRSRGGTPAEHDMRPVRFGGVERRAMAALAKHVSKGPLWVTCGLVQLGQGTSSGTQTFGTTMRLHMELNPNHAVRVGHRNAFSEIERRALIRELTNGPSLACMLRYTQSELQPKSVTFFLDGGRPREAGYRRVDGRQQGSFSAGSGFNKTSVKTGNLRCRP